MRILLIHTAFIGDIILSTPLIKKLKETYKDAEITYLTTPVGASILRNNPNIKEIIAYDKRGAHKGFWGVVELGRRLRHKNFNIVIAPHRYFRTSLLSWLSRAPIRVGYEVAAGSFLYTHLVKYKKELHEVDRLLELADFEIDKNKGKKYDVELYPGATEEEKIDEILKDYPDKRIITIAPGSKWFTKKWPLEYFNNLILNLSKNSDIIQVIVGGAEEAEMNVKLSKNCIDLRGKTTLLELSEIIKRSEIVLTNDSSPIHIASAFEDTHIIAIFGPTTKELGFFPYSKNSYVFERENLRCRPCGLHGGNSCPKTHFKCMIDIKPEIILEYINNYLYQKKK